MLWNNDNFVLSIPYKSTTKPDKWFMQLLAPTTHTAPSSLSRRILRKKIAITWKSQNNLKIDLKFYIKDCSFWHLKEKYRPWNTGNRKKTTLWTLFTGPKSAHGNALYCLFLSVTHCLNSLTHLCESTGLTIIREREISDEIFGKVYHKILNKSTKIQINI